MMPVEEAERRSRWFWWGKLLVYVAFFASFALLYAVLAPRPTLGGVLATLGGCVLLVAGIIAVGSVVFLRRWRREQAVFNDANAALARGQLQHAHDGFVRCSASANRTLSALARHNLAWTLMRQARLEDALGVLRDNDAAHERELERMSFHASSSVDIALVAGLLGRTEEAASWLEITDQRARGGGAPALPGMSVFARAVLACRQDRSDDAARMLDERWGECEATLTGAEVRPLRIVRAFAHAARGPRSAGVAEQLLSSAQPVYEDEYAFLGTSWPEMRTFLVTHRLVRSAPP